MMKGILTLIVLTAYGSRYSRMDQLNFVEDRLWKSWSNMVWLSRPHHFKFFKDCLPQILRGPFLNTLTHMLHKKSVTWPFSWCMIFHFNTLSFPRVYAIVLEKLFADLLYSFSKDWSKGTPLSLLVVCLTVKSPSRKFLQAIGKVWGRAKQSSQYKGKQRL